MIICKTLVIFQLLFERLLFNEFLLTMSASHQLPEVIADKIEIVEVKVIALNIIRR